MLVVYCRASSLYTGRGDARRSLGDVVLVLRPEHLGGDGSALLIPSEGVTVGNWMKAGSTITETDFGWDITNERTGERLQVFVDEVFSQHARMLELPSKQVMYGAERQLANVLAENLDEIEPGLRLVSREYRTSAGPIDLLCVEGPDDRPVCIEVKRVHASTNAVFQLKKYLTTLVADQQWHDHPAPRAILVGPSLAKPGKALIDADDQITFRRIKFLALLEKLGLDPAELESSSTASCAGDAKVHGDVPEKPKRRR